MNILKVLFSTILLFAVFTLSAQNTGMTLLQGKIASKTIPASIALYSVEDGDLVLHSKVKVAADGSFGFYFKPECAGFYRIGERNSPARIYLSPSKQTFIQLTDSSFSTSTQDLENSKMEQWSRIIGRISIANQMKGNYTYKDIFPLLPAVEKQKDAFLAGLKTKTSSFDKLLYGLVQAEFEYELYRFMMMPRTVHPDRNDLPEVYKRLSETVHFQTTEALKYDFGQQFLSFYIQHLSFNTKPKDSTSPSDFMDELATENLKNDTIKGWYFLKNKLIKSKAYDQAYKTKLDKYQKYIFTKSQKIMLYNFEKSIRTLGIGQDAFNFEGNTMDGKKVSLSDFKGKVVLVDVWATWCGPCKKELPALQQLETELNGKDVVVISYSIDEIKNIEKWKSMIVDQKLGGIQLIGEAAFKSVICANYGITGVPRFMLFDKNGKIVSTDAPRPSDTALKTLIEKELQK